MHHRFPLCAIPATPHAWTSSTRSMPFRRPCEACSTLASALESNINRLAGVR